MNTTYRVAIACSTALLLAGCAKSDQTATDTGGASTSTISLADAAGQWQVRSVPESGTDTTSTNYVLTATADTAGWFITFPNGLKVPVQAMIMGDSLMQKAGPFASQRRKGVMVTTEGMFAMQNGKLMGTTIARYSNAGADSVLRLRTEGTKIP
ncbi:MAG: hypothetical protein ABIR92_03635 [Gemmatimonadaceae bacterium]